MEFEFNNIFAGPDDAAALEEFHERINPHELADAARALWIRDLWGEFVDLARNGVITLFDAKRIAEDLRVDGEEAFLEQVVPLEERQAISFARLIELLDSMSRSSSEEYRDLDVDRGDSADAVQLVGPLDYLRHLCCARTATEGNEEEEDGVAAAAVEYKLSLTGLVDITPKRVLLASTGSLMLLICAGIIAGLATMWSQAAAQQEAQTLRNFQGAVEALITTVERELLTQHTLAMVDQGRIFGAWTEIAMQEEREELARSLAQSAARKAAAASTLMDIERSSDGDAVMADILRRFEALAPNTRLSDDSVRSGQVAFESAIVAPTGDGGCGAAERIPLTAPNASVCLELHSKQQDERLHAYKRRALSKLASAIDHANAVSLREPSGNAAGREAVHSTLAVLVVDDGGDVGANILTANNVQCVGPQREWLCADLAARVRSRRPADLRAVVPLRVEGRFFENETSIVGASHVPDLGAAITASVAEDDFLEAHRWRTVAIVDILNFNFIRSTEIVVALRNRTTAEVIPQATKFRFDYGCFFDCERFPPSVRNIMAGFVHRDFGWSITPDYRPEPVVGAYTHVGSGLDIVLCLERDVLEIRGLSFDFLTSIINDVNTRTPGSLELELVGFEGIALMRNFYVFEPCPTEQTDCIVDPRGTEDVNGSFGLIFRYDCQHCQRIERRNHTDMMMYTVPQKIKEADGAVAIPGNYRGYLRSPGTGNVELRDYAGDDVLAAFGYLENYSVILVAKVDRVEVLGPVNNAIVLSVVCGFTFLVGGMALLVLLSHRSFDAIEAEWASYKRQIEKEQARFASLVRGVIPPAVAERLMRGSKLLFDYVPCASFAFVDLCSFSTFVKHWSAKHVARLATYCTAVMEEVCAVEEVTKLRTIGDLFTCVALREEQHKAAAAQHPVCRSMRFSCILMQLFSGEFSHFPHTVRAFRDVFKDCAAENRTTLLPQIRIGVHCGPSVSGAFAVGTASHYDFFGAGPALANRMQQTASPGRIHTTMMVKELLKSRDPEHRFIFDAPRKTVVRGQGTITSYFVKAMTVEVPNSVLAAMGIRRAVQRRELVQRGKQHGATHDRQSNGSRSSRASHASHRSSVMSNM